MAGCVPGKISDRIFIISSARSAKFGAASRRQERT
jgi:hypothetical protein